MVPRPLNFSPRVSSSYSDGSTSRVIREDVSSIRARKGAAVELENWGYPGHLTDVECDVYEAFRKEVYGRDYRFRSTIFSFGETAEDEAYALCRWLRARKFVLSDTIRMVEEATVCRQEHADANFYENPKQALGVELSTYIAQYPQLYTGFTKTGCPLFISKPGVLCTGGLECITTISGILRYHWYEMIHNFGGALKESISINKNFKRFEVVCVIDLAHLSSTQVNKRALNIVKEQSAIDSLCFPETLNRLLVINAPSFFSLTWKMISGWVDARTANKVEIYSSLKKAQKRLLELIDEKELPSDYGGTAVSTVQSLERDWLVKEDDSLRRQVSKLITLRSNSHLTVDLSRNEMMKSSAFTRCTSGAKFHFSQVGSEKNCLGVVVKHVGEGISEENPTRVDFEETFSGPCTIKIKVDGMGHSFSSRNFLFIGKIYDVVAVKRKNSRSDRDHNVNVNIPRTSSKIEFQKQADIITSKRSTEKSLMDIPLSPPNIRLPNTGDSLFVRRSNRQLMVDVPPCSPTEKSMGSLGSLDPLAPQTPIALYTPTSPIHQNDKYRSDSHVMERSFPHRKVNSYSQMSERKLFGSISCNTSESFYNSPTNARGALRDVGYKSNIQYVMEEDDTKVGPLWGCGWRSCW